MIGSDHPMREREKERKKEIQRQTGTTHPPNLKNQLNINDT